MRNKASFQQSLKSNFLHAFGVKQSSTSNVQKKTQNSKTKIKKSSFFSKKAINILKSNIHIFMKGKFPFQAEYRPLIKNIPEIVPQREGLPSSDIEDQTTHDTLATALTREYALHASATWQKYVDSKGRYFAPPIAYIPRSWKEMHSYGTHHFNLSKKALQFQELIYEIILTEQSFLDDLVLTYKIFIADCITCACLPESVKFLFESMHQIIILHTQLLKTLRDRQSQTQVVYTITDIFREFLLEFRIYSDYFAIFEKASDEISQCIREQNEFGSFITRRQSWQECRNLPFTAYLLTPIQRVMKYTLFFNSLMECLGEHDLRRGEHASIISSFDCLLRYFEQQQKDAEEFTKLQDLALRLKQSKGQDVVDLVQPGRKLIYEGYLNIIPPESSAFVPFNEDISFCKTPLMLRRGSTFSIAPKKNRRSYVFLFNDMILFTKLSKKKFKREEKISKSKKNSYYGPSPNAIFKVIHLPGQLTALDASLKATKKDGRMGKVINVFRRNTLKGHRQVSPTTESHEAKPEVPELHPTQFYCSIATKNLANFHFEADSAESKAKWCEQMTSVMGEHLKRGKNKAASIEQELEALQPEFFNSESSSNDSSFGESYIAEEFSMELDNIQMQDEEEARTEALKKSILSAFDSDFWSGGSPDFSLF